MPDCVLSRQSAALQQDKERWTLCLRDWCLVLKHSWRTLFIWYIYDIWRCRPHYHHHLVAAVSVHSHLKRAVQIYFLCVYVLMHLLRNNYIYTHACLWHCRITNSLFALQLCVVSWRLKSPWTPDFKTEKLKENAEMQTLFQAFLNAVKAKLKSQLRQWSISFFFFVPLLFSLHSPTGNWFLENHWSFMFRLKVKSNAGQCGESEDETKH